MSYLVATHQFHLDDGYLVLHIVMHHQTVVSFSICSLQSTHSRFNLKCSLWGIMTEHQEHSSSSISSSTQESEEELTIGTLITEATNTTNSAKSLGRRLSHLDSIPVLFSLLRNMFLW